MSTQLWITSYQIIPARPAIPDGHGTLSVTSPGAPLDLSLGQGMPVMSTLRVQRNKFISLGALFVLPLQMARAAPQFPDPHAQSLSTAN